MLKNGIFLILILFCQSLIAQSVPNQQPPPQLNIAISFNQPPFVYSAGKDHFYGFDISMMVYICKKINRRCHFTSMPFKDLFHKVSDGDYDVAVSALTATPERAKLVRFSLPYMLSYYQFLVHSNFNQPFTLTALQNNKIGYVEGTIFSDVLYGFGLKDNIYSFIDEPHLASALYDDTIQIAIADKATVDYWVVKGNGKFKAWSKPEIFGDGFAIAVRPDQPDLLNQINRAVRDFINSDEYKTNYKIYINTDLSI